MKEGERRMKSARAALLLTLATAACAQVNVGEQKPEASLPFKMTSVATFGLPWRLAFLPDGRMLVTEKIGPIWLVSPQGEKIAPLGNTPAVFWQRQNGMLGIFVSPHYATDQSVYLTYIEPGDYGGGQVLARAKLNAGRVPRLEDFEVLWRQMPRAWAAKRAGKSLSRPTASTCS
jgi:glucose/arabinose dehydrogenase